MTITREDALIKIAAAILANPSINSVTANAADVVMQARRVVDRIIEPPPAQAAAQSPPNGHSFGVRDGEWLVRAATKRAAVGWFVAYGLEHGYPSRMQFWSPAMVAQAIAARNKAAVLNGVMP